MVTTWHSGKRNEANARRMPQFAALAALDGPPGSHHPFDELSHIPVAAVLRGRSSMAVAWP